MVLRSGKSRLTINLLVALGILAVLLVSLFLVSRDVKTQSTGIKSAKNDLKTRIQQLSDLARLREEAKLAEPSLVRLEAVIPSRDNLFSTRRELEQAAARNNLAANFAFGAQNPKEGTLGSINFEMKLTGGDYSIRTFINEIESRYPFVKLAALDMVRQENDFSSTLKGQILFKE